MRWEEGKAMREYKDFHLCCGLGAAARGFKEAVTEFKGLVGKFRCLGGVDVDAEACEDFRKLTGALATRLDLFSLDDYIAFHGKEPPQGWREATPEDLRAAAGYEFPDCVFLSPPCKGFSGLLPSQKAASEKYQALNRLVVRGLKLTLDAFADDIPAVIMIENVPRITSRGEWLLRQIKNLLAAHGYVFHEGTHDCGKIGGLGQHRKRYLLIARLPEKMTSFVYKPPQRRVKSIGDIIGPMPLPDDLTAGPMHRLSRLKWLTWVRLALIPAGGDWRDLEKIAQEQYRLEYIPRGAGPYGVQDWRQPGATVIGNSFVKGSNPVAVADPRLNHIPREGVYKVQDFNEPSTTVTGAARVNTSNGAACIADPRLPERGSRHPNVYHVVKYDEPAHCVTGTRFGSGALAISDPRTGGGFTNKYQLLYFGEPATTITGTPYIQSGAPSIADPRLGLNNNAHHAICQMNEWDGPANTVTGATRPAGGAISVADPRIGCEARSGTMGVQAWDKPGKTVIGAGDIHAGAAAVADPRIPVDNDHPDPPPVIIALDGTWHRPLTTLELAALQGLPTTLEDGSPLVLAGKNDARWRERIGNAVPPPAARAIAEQILNALLVSETDGWALGATGVWVRSDASEEIDYAPLSHKSHPFTRGNGTTSTRGRGMP
ncbi:MAG TPA: DNA cytosine methyltransferase [Desulfotomaculum sp.]|nr:DNA cytosine methyltransferase [Desulfotomaculum sp.]